MEYSPPPLFKQGASARVKVVFFSLLAIGLLLADARLHSLGVIRQVVGIALYPLQQVALMPRDVALNVADYFSSLSTLRRENHTLKSQQVANSLTIQQAQLLAAENAQLRKLLAANERMPVKSMVSEILYDARDAFTRKIVLDRGSRHGVAPGQPVIDDIGVVGQVTRVFPFTSEITLLTDKDQAIPVQIVRSGLRSVVYGQGHAGSLDLRFIPANADVKNGDVLVTSGIDGVYPPGLAVAKIVQVESKSSDAFARIVCQPLAGINRNRQLLILLTDQNFPERPQPVDPVKEKQARKAAAEAAKAAGTRKDAPQDGAPAPVKPAAGAPAAGAPAAGAPAAGTAAAGAQRQAAPASPNAGAAAKAQNTPASPNAAASAKPPAPSQPPAAPNAAAAPGAPSSPSVPSAR